jgi:hypothetical protein
MSQWLDEHRELLAWVAGHQLAAEEAADTSFRSYGSYGDSALYFCAYYGDTCGLHPTVETRLIR